MKKQYNSVRFDFIALKKLDIICGSTDFSISSTGVTGDDALAPSRGFSPYEEY